MAKKLLLLRVVHRIRMYCSPDYRKAYNLKKGKRIWNKLDEKLPPITGVKGMDEIRLRMFDTLTAEISVEEQKQLLMWLKQEFNYWEKNFTEHTSAKIEQAEEKARYKYQIHLERLQKTQKEGG